MELKIEYVSIDSLTPYEKNARKHEDFDVNFIKNSIKEFGMCDPIGIWGKNNIIVEGHGRLIALKELGYKEVPVIRLDHLNDEQRRAYSLAHNRTAEMSVWDDETLMAELNDLDNSFDFKEFGFSEFMNIEEEDPDITDDDFEPIPFPTSNTKSGDIFVLGDHKLLCGDSTSNDDLHLLLGDEVVDLFYTDPPYNVNVSNSEGDTIENDDLPDDMFKDLLLKAFANASSVLKPGGSFYVWHGDSERVNFQLCLEEHGLFVKQCLIWVKNGFNFGRQDYKWQHEPCLYGWKDGAGHYFVPEFNHPTMKPLSICGLMIHNSSRKEDIVLDLFGGSGSTLIACDQLHRKCRMIELDPKYVDVIVRRYIKFKGSTDGCHLVRNGEELPLPKEFESAVI